jgi:hypothetical protein
LHRRKERGDSIVWCNTVLLLLSRSNFNCLYVGVCKLVIQLVFKHQKER